MARRGRRELMHRWMMHPLTSGIADRTPVPPINPRTPRDSDSAARLGISHALRDQPGELLLLLRHHETATPTCTHHYLRTISVLRRSHESIVRIEASVAEYQRLIG